ncbi:hypothetical protein H4217_007952 [Coemansia sp. RSA 1939]|nr:hypothetical protein H4217_007952 [Coemansia sp. RSA 1939]
MKVTSTIFALAYAAMAVASPHYVASSAPALPTPKSSPVATTAIQSVQVTPVPIVIADFIYSPAIPASVTSGRPAPAVPSAPAPAVPTYEAHLPPAAHVAPTVIAAPSMPPAAPAPTTSSQPAYVSHKRDIEQSSIDNLVEGKGAMMFEVDGKSYMLMRLPVDLAKKVTDKNIPLVKRANGNDLIAHATTRDLGSDSLLYNLLGKVYLRITVPINVKLGITDPEDNGGSGRLLRRDLLDNLLGEVVASVVAPVNVIANINPDEDGNGLVPNLLGRVSATIQASPTVTLHIFDSDKDEENDLMRRDLVEDLLGEVLASVVAPVNVIANINPDEDGNGLVPNLLGRVSATVQVVVAPVNVIANINPDEDGNGLVPNLLGRVSATIQASPTVTLHIFDSDKDEENDLMRRDLVEDLLGEVLASVVAPVNVIANINPDEDGNGLVPNLLGRVSATVQVSPTVTLHLLDSDKDNDSLLRRDLLDNLLGEVVASAVAPVNVIANINPDEDGNGLVPNLLGRVSATIQASPTVTLHILDSDKDDSGSLLKRSAAANGIYTEKIDDTHVAIYVPLSTLTKHKSEANVTSLLSAAGSESIQVVSVASMPTKVESSAPTPMATGIQNDIYLRIVVPKSSLL